ncbi:Hypothetical predicted protein [Octopus vulgaris]|uniref:Uncharacterized protein n=1 Tax=Octopus vulgaris TaxID=6645 RepID=A0AA36FHM4_OCTVU|nr:Hypothetical predicted protein [Octopus vulgaris]
MDSSKILSSTETELEDIKATWIAPDIHEQLKIDLSKLTSERDILEEIEKKDILLRKLGSDLNTERHLRFEIEDDLEEKNKIIEEEIEKKDILLRKLGSDLNTERHLQFEIEYDLEEKNKIISLKDNNIRELNNQIRDLKKLQDQLDEYDNIKN